MRYAMIMAGGAGTRLWPMSRKEMPKQLIKFIQTQKSTLPPTPSQREGALEMKSLLEIAAGRLEGVVPHEKRFICTSESFRTVIRRDLPEFSDERIMGEPVGRDTVNAVGFAAAVFQKLDKDAVFSVLTADHIIEPQDVFRERMDLGYKLVEADPKRLVTFSVKPTFAATGYGYVERGTPIRGVPGCEQDGKSLAFHVARFVEKPDLPRAQAYFQSGSFNWNSGMFVWKASTFLEALKKFKPESHAGMMEIQKAWGTKTQQETIARVYPNLPKISVDFAIMEPASKDKDYSICTVQMDVKWLDVGSWPTYGETLTPDASGNRTANGSGHSLIQQGKNNLIVNGGKNHTVALLGVDDLIVIHTDDATLIMPKSKAEDLKHLHGQVEERLK
ncbi:MAG: mannose-1-phosphate guanylyltransferase [Phycisphaeraceae bacterium]|nr:mannose-1-phosphate guanylyltransferase [Phycisphaeraceae bacterium]